MTAWVTAVLSLVALVALLWRIAKKIDRVVSIAEAIPDFTEGTREEFRLIWWALGQAGVSRPNENEMPFPAVVNIWHGTEVPGRRAG